MHPARALCTVDVGPSLVADADEAERLGALAVVRAVVSALLDVARVAAPARGAEAAPLARQAQPAEAAVARARLQLAAAALGKWRAVASRVDAVADAGALAARRRGAGDALAVVAAIAVEAVAHAALAQAMAVAVARARRLAAVLARPALVAVTVVKRLGPDAVAALVRLDGATKAAVPRLTVARAVEAQPLSRAGAGAGTGATVKVGPADVARARALDAAAVLRAVVRARRRQRRGEQR